MSARLEMVAMTTAQIYLIIYLINTKNNIDKKCDKVGQKIKFPCKMIGCEIQEGAE